MAEPEAFIPVPLASDGSGPLAPSSDEIRALDADLKRGRSAETIGGARSVH
jgi:hypothetical protein